MALSMKDALRKAGLAPPAEPPRRIAKEFREELPDDETLPPRFEAPALTVARPLEVPAPSDERGEGDEDGESPSKSTET
jgi:hypothetical protein